MDVREETREAAELRAEARSTLITVVDLLRATRPSELVELGKGASIPQDTQDMLWRDWVNLLKDIMPRFKDLPILLLDDIIGILKERSNARTPRTPTSN